MATANFHNLMALVSTLVLQNVVFNDLKVDGSFEYNFHAL